ncbi:hypothetical protein HS7_16320 [Sulfolobales archaeon HS-7]|nr:hypothetical protein HS7_16320 [Sulfolobales archaeon HS-7]
MRWFRIVFNYGLGFLRRGLGTVIGTIIFLLIVLASLAALGIFFADNQAISTEISQAQLHIQNKNQEDISVTLSIVKHCVIVKYYTTPLPLPPPLPPPQPCSLPLGEKFWGSYYEINIIIKNIGSVVSHIDSLEMLDAIGGVPEGTPWYREPLNLNLAPGQEYSITYYVFQSIQDYNNVTYGLHRGNGCNLNLPPIGSKNVLINTYFFNELSQHEFQNIMAAVTTAYGNLEHSSMLPLNDFQPCYRRVCEGGG